MKLIVAVLIAVVCSTASAQNGAFGECIAAGIWASGIKGQPKEYWLKADTLVQMREPLLSMHKRFVALIFIVDNRMNPEQISEYFTHECLEKNGDLSQMFVGVRT